MATSKMYTKCFPTYLPSFFIYMRLISPAAISRNSQSLVSDQSPKVFRVLHNFTALALYIFLG